MGKETTTSGEPPKVTIDTWREALAHIRHLSDDVWKGLLLFLTPNVFFLPWLVGLLSPGYASHSRIALAMLVSLAGGALALGGRWVLQRHRIYYLQMLARKALIEHELRLYETKLSGSTLDLAFPWRLEPTVVAEIVRDAEYWIQKSVRAPGTIARIQFWIYEALLGAYALAFLIALIRLIAGR